MKKHKKSFNNKIKNILIVNVHSSKNSGDYALLIQTINYLKEAFGDVVINILANWPDEPPLQKVSEKVIGSPWWVIKVWDKNKKPRYQVFSFIMGFLFLFLYKFDFLSVLTKYIPDPWKRIFREYKNNDLIVAVSGNQLFSSGRFGWPLPVIGMPIFLGFCFDKKTLVFPQSIGPLDLLYEKAIVRYLYNHVDKLFVRDLESLKLVNRLGIKKSKPSFMHDVAFTLPAFPKEKALNILHKIGFDSEKKNIGITIISTMPSYLATKVMENYYSQFALLIEALILENFDIYLFSQVYGPTKDEDDFHGIELVLKQIVLPPINRIRILNKRLHPSELKACYGLMDVFIASRLHSGIFSLGMQVPTFFIGYLYKTKGILRALNLNDFHVELEDFNHENLKKKVTYIYSEKYAIQQRIQKQLVKVQNELSDLPEQIIEGLNIIDH